MLVLLAAERATCLTLFKSAQGAYVCPNNLAQQGRFSLAGVTLVLFHAVEPATRFMLLQFPQECACPNSPAQQGGFSLAGVTLVLLHAGARATCFMLLGVPSKTAQNWCVQSAQLHVAVLFLRRLQTCVMIFANFAFANLFFACDVCAVLALQARTSVSTLLAGRWIRSCGRRLKTAWRGRWKASSWWSTSMPS